MSNHTNVCLECGHDRNDIGAKLISADNGLRQKEATRQRWRSIFHLAWFLSVLPASDRTGILPNPPAADPGESMTVRHGQAAMMTFGLVGLAYLLISDAHWTWRLCALVAAVGSALVAHAPWVHRDLKDAINAALALGVGIVGLVHWLF